MFSNTKCMKFFNFSFVIILLFFCHLINANGESKIKIIINNSDKTVIVKGQKVSQQEANIIQLLQQRIQEKTGILVQIIDENKFNISDSKYDIIIIPGCAKSSNLLNGIMSNLSVGFPQKKESFKLLTERYHSKNIVLIAGSDELGILYGEGKLLRTADYKGRQMAITGLNIDECPLDNSRGIYYAIHCNNWYEDIPETAKIKDLIKEQGLWGSNILWMWFDISMYHKGPFEENSDSKNKWERIKQMSKAASDIGIKVGFVEIANAAYLDQVNDSIKAVGGEPPEGLLCPRANNGEAMHIMEGNYRDLYQDLKKNGITVNAISLAFYDRGGCHCNLCKPWVATGINYIGNFHANLINEYFSGCDLYLNDWHFASSDGVDEVEWTKDYLKSANPDWIKGIHRDDRHPWDRWTGIDQKYDVATFFDISMIGGWGGFGANPFPKRLDTFFNGMHTSGIKGGMSYTEGIFDDINKVLVLQHHWGKNSSDSILKEYARWYFNADDKTQQIMSDILFDMESEWSNIYSNWNQNLITKAQLNIKKRIDNLEALLPENIKDMWRWKLIHARVSLAQTAVDISGLEGSGYDEFISELNSLLSLSKVDTVAVNQMIKEKERWLNQKLQLFDKEYKELYYGIYEGMKNGMYGGVAPDPGRWIKGFNKGEKWREMFNKKIQP
jgi:hypothetical protein